MRARQVARRHFRLKIDAYDISALATLSALGQGISAAVLGDGIGIGVGVGVGAGVGAGVGVGTGAKFQGDQRHNHTG